MAKDNSSGAEHDALALSTGLAAGIGAPASPKTRNGSLFGPLFRSEWAPLGGLRVRNFDAGAKFRALFLVWAPHFGSKQKSKCEFTTNHGNHPVDRPKMHVVWYIVIEECASCPREMTHRKNAHFVQISSPPIFAQCFLPSAARSFKKIMGLGGSKLGFLGLLGPV